jgi:hypothetical protein
MKQFIGDYMTMNNNLATNKSIIILDDKSMNSTRNVSVVCNCEFIKFGQKFGIHIVEEFVREGNMSARVTRLRMIASGGATAGRERPSPHLKFMSKGRDYGLYSDFIICIYK